MHSQGGPRTNPTAVVALIVSLSGFVCLFGVGGLVGIVLGVLARGEIRRSDPHESGARLAGAAIALGLFQLALLIAGIGALVAGMVRPPVFAPAARAPATAPPPAPAPVTPVVPPGRSRGTLDPRQRESVVGRITLVDLGANSAPLSAVFQAELQSAQASGGKALAFVVAPDCLPCNGVALALNDARIQKGLAGARLIRVDVRDRAEELVLLGIPVDTIPGLALLAPGARPSDYLHGGEWDADIPDNIAPVLIDFVSGGNRPRRYPWRGLRRPDETAL